MSLVEAGAGAGDGRSGRRTGERCQAESVRQADTGADLDFLLGGSGHEVPATPADLVSTRGPLPVNGTHIQRGSIRTMIAKGFTCYNP